MNSIIIFNKNLEFCSKYKPIILKRRQTFLFGYCIILVIVLGVLLMSKEINFKNRDRFIELGITISAIRKMKGLSQEALADKANISRSHLSSIEAPNIVRPFSLEVLYNIADALEISAGDLLNIKFPFSDVKKESK